MMGRKQIPVVLGDLFAIPRADGKYVLGQVLNEWRPGVVCIAVLDHLLEREELEGDPKDAKAIALPSVGKAELGGGYWRIIGHKHLLVDPALGAHHQFASAGYIGASWHSGGKIEALVNAFYGLATWEPYPGRPGHLRSLLLPNSPH